MTTFSLSETLIRLSALKGDTYRAYVSGTQVLEFNHHTYLTKSSNPRKLIKNFFVLKRKYD